VDHIIDSFGARFLMSGLAASGLVRWPIATAMAVAFLLLSIETYLASYTLGVFRLSFAKLGPTELRLLLAAGNAALCSMRRCLAGMCRLFDFGGLIAAAGMGMMAVAAAVSHRIAALSPRETVLTAV
jgi:archaetidylinositol phosphate synthase